MCDVSNSKNESTDFVIEIEHLPKIQSIKYGDTKYFKSSKIVKLEALDENLIGGIIQIELYDNRFYILDKYSYRSNLYVFDLAGNYLNR
ncbi:6-bladed beta-propeller [Bacteroides sp. 1_1_14]|uniref:6-bladed beta-propeller n=1 Tax=Bacteroides sp. 1_1_14 TaxID=469585 RepID=UPI00240E766B|nr:6-bladed beta-propeller [Bacteroides sp. 1_1_14]